MMQGGWVLNGYFSLLVGYEARDQYTKVSKSKSKATATFVIIFGVHMSISFILKVKILVLAKWSYMKVLLNLLTIELRTVIIIFFSAQSNLF